MKLSTSINAIISSVLLTVLCVMVAPVFAHEINMDRAAFFKALERRDVKSIELFLSKGISVNIVNDKGDTPLTLASRRGYLDVAKLLVSKGALVDLQNRKGESALMLAASGNCWDFVIFLLQGGADINKKDYLGRTALWYAKNCMLDCRASEKILLANGATADAEEIGKQAFPCDKLPSDLVYEFGESKRQLLFSAGIISFQGFLREGDNCRPVVSVPGRFSRLDGILSFMNTSSHNYPDIIIDTKAPYIGDVKTVYAWNGNQYALEGLQESIMLNDKALRVFERGEIQEAIVLWEKAYGLALLPFIGLTANAEVINNLGFAYHKIARKTRSMADYQKVVKYYKETIRVDKKRWQVYLNYADYYREVNNPRHAIENYELLLELNPNYKYADKIRNKIISLRQGLTDVSTSAAKEEQYKSETPSVEIRFKPGKQMILLSKGGESSIDLNDSVRAAGDLDGKVFFSSYKNDNMYLLLDIFGPSKIPGGPGYCGAGEEYNVVWLRLDSRLKLLDIKSALYDSCLESTSVDPEPKKNEPRYKIQNNAVKIDYKSFSTYHSLYYDNNKPKAGLTITSSPY